MKQDYKLIDTSTWSRREHFEFFSTMSEPNFNVCVTMQMNKLLNFCLEKQLKVSEVCMFLAQHAINESDNFNLRIVDNKVVECTQIGINAVSLTQDKTIRFTYIPYKIDYQTFVKANRSAINQANSENFISSTFKQNQASVNTVYLSILPWLSFTSFRHATDQYLQNGVPKLVFGQLNKQSCEMPMSIEVHHGLADGYHVGMFVSRLQALFNEPQSRIDI